MIVKSYRWLIICTLFNKVHFCYNKVMLEQIVLIISIITFFSAAIAFFVKIGEYKNLINNEITGLKDDVRECKEDIKDLEHEIESVKTNNNQLMTLLIEVKTKLEFIMNANGILKNNE